MTSVSADKISSFFDTPTPAIPFEIIGDKITQARISKMINRIAASQTGRDVLETACKAGYAVAWNLFWGATADAVKKKS
ncbi:unknown [Acetobacter sp. CAG:977]|nr:unknown [Acetobacter sp. CAG:977]